MIYLQASLAEIAFIISALNFALKEMISLCVLLFFVGCAFDLTA